MNKDLIEKFITHITESSSVNNSQDICLNDKVHTVLIDGQECILRELTWKEGLIIDMQSYKKRGKDLFFNDHAEKIAILKTALISIDNNEIVFENLEIDFLNKLWDNYKQYLHLSIKEINFIYESAKKYFSPNENEIFPLHPLIIEVDYMTKGLLHYNKDEFNNLSMREFEAIQLILATKNEI